MTKHEEGLEALIKLIDESGDDKIKLFWEGMREWVDMDEMVSTLDEHDGD